MPNETRNPNAQEAQCPQTRGFGSRSISICPNRRRPRESLVLVAVLVLVIGNGAVDGEDEKEDDDDLVAAPLRSAVAIQSCCSSFPSFSSVFVTEGNEDNEEEWN